jgi:hypothetical protein
MDSSRAARLFQEAESHFGEKRFDEALALLDQLAAAIPQHEAVEFARAQALVMLGRGAEAIALCDALAPLFGDEGVIELKEALVHLPNTDDDELRLGFLRPTNERVSFAALDGDAGDGFEGFPDELGLLEAGVEDDAEFVLPPMQLLADGDDTVEDVIPLPDESLPSPGEFEPPSDAAREQSDALAPDVDEPTRDDPPVPEAQAPHGGPVGLDSDLGELGPLSPLEEEPPAEAEPPRPMVLTEGLGDLGDICEVGDLDDPVPSPPPPAASTTAEDLFSAQASSFEAGNDLGALPDWELPEPDHLVTPQPDAEPEPEPEPQRPREPEAPAVIEPWDAVSDFESPSGDVQEPVRAVTPPQPAYVAPAPPAEEAAVYPPRYDDATTFDPPPAPPPAVARQQASPPRRSRVPVVAGLVLLALAGAGAFLYVQGHISIPGMTAASEPTPDPAVAAPTGEVSAPRPPTPSEVAPEPSEQFSGPGFAAALAQLGPQEDPGPLIEQLRTVGNLGQWPSRDKPALRMVIDRAAENGAASASASRLQLARYLLNAGADPNQADARGRTALDDAAGYGDEALVELLIDRGAVVTPSVMVWLARSGRLPLIQNVLERQPDAASAEVLYAAIDGRHEAVAQTLLEQGVRVEDVLEAAVQSGTRHVFRYATEKGVQLSQSSHLLHTAIDAQQPAILELLLRAGADANVRNPQGLTPLQALQAKKQPTHADAEMQRLLAEYQTVKRVDAVATAPPAVAHPASQGRPLGMLLARSKQREEAWAEVGPMREPVVMAADKVYRLNVEADTPADVAALKDLRPADLYALRLSGPGVTDESLAHVGHLSGLRELELVGAPVSDTGLQHVRKLSLLVSLRIASPPGSPRAQINGPGLTHLRPMLNLAHLDLSGTTAGDRAMPLVDSITTIRSLNVSGTNITDAALAGIRNLRNLEVLVVGSDTGLVAKVNGSALYGVRELTGLRALHLYGVPMSATGFEVLQGLRNLNYVDLRKTGLTAADVPRISKLTHIATLDLGENDLPQDARTALQKALPTATLKF